MINDQHDSWKKLGSKTLFRHPRLTLTEDDVLLPDGARTKYLMYEGLGDYVTVIPERQAGIALIRDYSYPLDQWLWQFPEGGIDSGEDPATAAARELAEETGLGAEKITEIGMNYGNHRRSKQKNYIFVASTTKSIERPAGDSEEVGIETHWLSLPEAREMLTSGVIKQKNALAALAVYFAYLDHKSHRA